jgi:hydrogenase maturation protein HypF
LPGGEAAIHQPWRTAVAVLDEALGANAADRVPFPGIAPRDKSLVRRIIGMPQFSPRTTSAGRLFDAAAAIVLGVEHADFDGQAAMMLEAAVSRNAMGSYDCPLINGHSCQLDWGPLFRQLLADQSRGVYADIIAMRFHRALAQGIASLCQQRSDLPVVLSGGVFQNRLLTELIVEQFSDSPQRLVVPEIIPPNDGGLAAGQLAIASAQIDKSQD